MFVLVTAAYLAVATPAPDAARPAPAPGTIIVEGKKEKKVCKTVVPHTGSRIGMTRVCHTAAEWKMSEEQSQRIIEKDQERLRAVQAYEQNAKNGLAAQGPQ